MKRYLISGAAIALFIASNAEAATNLTSVAISSQSNTIWNTKDDNIKAVFLLSNGQYLNGKDNFTFASTKSGKNEFYILGDGVNPVADPRYTITLKFADGATISGDYFRDTFLNGTSATVGGTAYKMTDFVWQGGLDCFDAVNPSAAVKGGSQYDYAGSFTFSATAVPEPATWAMMLVGFALVGGAARYRSRKSSVVFG